MVTVAIMSVWNTVTIVVFERTREFGTLRALGMRPGRLLRLVATEGAALGLAGAAVAVALSIAVPLAVNAAHVTYTPPGVSAEVSLKVDLLPWQFLINGVVVAALCALVSVLPARRAARIEVVEALRHA